MQHNLTLIGLIKINCHNYCIFPPNYGTGPSVLMFSLISVVCVRFNKQAYGAASPCFISPVSESVPVAFLDHPHKPPALLLLLPLLPTNQPVTVKHLHAVHQCSNCAGERTAPKSIWSRRGCCSQTDNRRVGNLSKANKAVGRAAPPLARRRSSREVSSESA